MAIVYKEEEKKEEPKQEKRLPYAEIKSSGGLKVVFWRNTKQKGDKEFKVLDPQFVKTWKDENGEWKHQNISLNMNDIYRLPAIIPQIKEVEERFKNEQKEKTNS